MITLSEALSIAQQNQNTPLIVHAIDIISLRGQDPYEPMPITPMGITVPRYVAFMAELAILSQVLP